MKKSYGKRPVLRGADLSVHPGEVLALLGPNGAGKTTCFYAILGLVVPDQGSVWIDGVNIDALSMFQRVRLGISYLPQETSIFHDLSVRQNILAVLELLRLPRKQRLERCETLLSDFRIDHLAHTRADALSGGERRRLEIARCLATSPVFLLLDEPFAGIDPLAISDVQQIVRQLRDAGIGILITDHNVRDTIVIANRVAIFFDGLVFKEGDAKTVMNDPKVRDLYLGEEFTV